MAEVDLSPAVKRFLEAAGFVVYSEVRLGDCTIDLLGERAGELLAVELKLRASEKLLWQAQRRLTRVDSVYCGVPAAPPWFRRLCWRAGVGVIRVDAQTAGCVILERAWAAVEMGFKRPGVDPQQRAAVLAALLAAAPGGVGGRAQGGSVRNSLAADGNVGTWEGGNVPTTESEA